MIRHGTIDAGHNASFCSAVISTSTPLQFCNLASDFAETNTHCGLVAAFITKLHALSYVQKHHQVQLISVIELLIFAIIGDMRIAKFCSNCPLLFVVITAFLAMQWTTAHIHLTEHHNHAGSYHEHQIETHAHHLIGQDTIAVDVSHHAGHANVIELDYEYSLPKREQQKNHSTVGVVSVFQLPPPSLLSGIEIPIVTNTKLSYLARSTVNPRAPPQTS